MVLQTIAVGLLVLAVVDGFRVTSRRQNRSMREVGELGIIADDDEGSTEALERAVEGFIRDHLPNTTILPSFFNKCNLSESQCNIRDMNGTTLVYPGNERSKCFNREDFGFLVRPGRLDKLLYYFPNGGACWEHPFKLPGGWTVCLQNMLLGLTATGVGMGFTNANWPGNKFADFTFVSPPYCDGSAHVGNTTFNGLFGDHPQHGYLNNIITVEWAKRNLDQTLENFVMAGSSAGSLGTMAWSHYLLNYFQYKKATVIVDSYMGVFPGGTQGPTINNFGVCDLPIWEHFRAECEANTTNIQDVFDYAIAAHPDVAFATIQDKTDGVQRLFYGMIALSFVNFRFYMMSYNFYKETNNLLQRYNRHPNHVHYYVEGFLHTHLWFPLYHTTTVTSATGLLGDAGRPKLEKWVNALIDHEPVLSQCHGNLERNGGDSPVFKNSAYCDKELHPKALFNRYCFEDNHDYYGRNIPFINPKTASSAEDCQDQCSRYRLCSYFTFETQKSTSNCWLKYSKSGRSPQSGLTSGDRACA